MSYRLIIGRACFLWRYPLCGDKAKARPKARIRIRGGVRRVRIGEARTRTAIRVTDIEPGLVGGTEFSNVRFKGDDAKADKTYENANALTPEDVTETVWWVATLPKHVNINTVEMMPVSQSFAGLSVHRG